MERVVGGRRLSPVLPKAWVNFLRAGVVRWSRMIVPAVAILVVLVACTSRFREHQLRQTPTLRPPVEAYARLVLLREVKKMRLAEHPYQWISYRFHQGVCFPGTIEEMEREDQRD